MVHIDVRDFRHCLTCLDVGTRDEHEEFIWDELIPKIDKKTTVTVEDIWTGHLNRYWDFMNYSLLEHVIRCIKDKSLITDMQAYTMDLKKFREETKLCDFIDKANWPVPSRKPPVTELKEIVVVLEQKKGISWEQCTLEDLENLQATMTRKIFCPKFAMILKDFKRGMSIGVTWLVPVSVSKMMMKDIQMIQEELLLYGITKVIIDGERYVYITRGVSSSQKVEVGDYIDLVGFSEMFSYLITNNLCLITQLKAEWGLDNS